MSEKRRDNKNRILHTGESQRQDGRYVYKYIDALGKTQFVYSWKLVSTDRIPAGKRNDLSLREKEKEIQKDIDDGIDTIGKKMTVCELYQKQIRTHGNVKSSTIEGRKRLLRFLAEDKIGGYTIDAVKLSDAKEWAIRMKEKGVAYQTINNDKRSMKAAFYVAIQDDCIRKNPFDFNLSTVIENDTEKKQPLTPKQEEKLLDFFKNDTFYRKYYDEIVILLGTGLRISEFCGLTKKDIDFENKRINVDHQLLYKPPKTYYIEETKTASGIRHIPMSETVLNAFQNVIAKHPVSTAYKVDGYTEFLFVGNTGKPLINYHYETVLRHAVNKYNKQHSDEEALFNITPHTLRHTFCTNMANAGMNPKALQYIMGHASITMTMNYYAHATFESVQKEFSRFIP
ncbi:MAG: site-specific integrase [Clostridia bacterium]|nr:site-specific integrase [Clostridia bacterium]